MSRRYMIDLAAITARADPFVWLMKGLDAIGAQLFVIASPGVSHDDAKRIVDSAGAPPVEIFVSAHDAKDEQGIAAWKVNVAKSLQVDLFIGVDEATVRTARLLGLASVLFMT